eukprot:CAMPEP_0115347092 /NCGR_PEP_ID=MMETSP0270-20121206/94692_1 /TAXON_ID=71861 /ORGANISM="Scrippsiella trochoidea, Strain CCMP3099" /LENGTH=58 /DNA_ID=CAMNT_0002768983 /DNA_START=209 /DNA_END=385 /DNA_ORIENTATION=+
MSCPFGCSSLVLARFCSWYMGKTTVKWLGGHILKAAYDSAFLMAEMMFAGGKGLTLKA